MLDSSFLVQGTVHNNDPPKLNILGVGVVPTTLSAAMATLERWRQEGRRDYVCCVSVHGLVIAQRDREVRQALNRSGLATQDGMPLVWWARRAGYSNAGRVCGPDLMEAICAASPARNYRHYFYGGHPVVVERLVNRLKERFPGFNVVGYKSPPFRALTKDEDEADVAEINGTEPDFVWVGLGMPKQERWMLSHVGRVHATALMGVGAAFDFHAGTKPRAPGWMQRSGLEWTFRLASEPRRLARRYIIDNSIFLFHALQQITGWKSYVLDDQVSSL